MGQMIETKLRYEKVNESGVVKKVSELYLVEALTFTEAEARIIEKMTPYISGEFTVNAVKKTKIDEIFNLEQDYFWLAKISTMITTESGAEKSVIREILVGGKNFEEAYRNFKEGMEGTTEDWELGSFSMTPILDVFTYDR